MPDGFTYGGQTILSHPIFVETVLPFLLVFTIVFAVLQKSKVLGEGKRQVDAIVALVTGLLVISFAQAIGIIVQLIPFLAVSLVIILVFMLLVGSFHKEGDFLGKKTKTALMILVIIAVVIAVLIITNAWEYIYDIILLGGDSNIVINIIFIVVIILAVIFVMVGSKAKSGSDKS